MVYSERSTKLTLSPLILHIFLKKNAKQENPVGFASGVFDKKTKEPLLLVLAFNVRTMTIEGSIPPLVPIPLPRHLIKPPNVIRFQNTMLTCTPALTYPHLHKSCQFVATLVVLVDNANETPFYRINELEEYSTTLAGIMVARFPSFLYIRVPSIRTDLLPEYHWVWDSLKRHMKTIAMVIIVSNHVIPREQMKYRKQDRCILTDRDNFITANLTL